MDGRRAKRGSHARVSERLSYANVMATLAVFIALGGGAWAVAIGRNDVGSREIAKNAVGTAELKDDKTKGKDVDESSLGEVPSAANADSAISAEAAATAANAETAETATEAGSVNGLSFATIDGEIPLDQPPQTVLDLGGLQLKATCTVLAGVTVSADTTHDNALLHASATEADDDLNETEDSNFDAVDDPALHTSGSEGTMTVYYRRAAGAGHRVVSATLAFEDAASTCQVYGHASTSAP